MDINTIHQQRSIVLVLNSETVSGVIWDATLILKNDIFNYLFIADKNKLYTVIKNLFVFLFEQISSQVSPGKATFS